MPAPLRSLLIVTDAWYPQVNGVVRSIDKTAEAVRAYQRTHQYTFPAAMAGAQSDRWFGKRKTLPEVFVVDREGRIVHAEGGEMFEEDVAALSRFAQK